MLWWSEKHNCVNNVVFKRTHNVLERKGLKPFKDFIEWIHLNKSRPKFLFVFTMIKIIVLTESIFFFYYWHCDTCHIAICMVL